MSFRRSLFQTAGLFPSLPVVLQPQPPGVRILNWRAIALCITLEAVFQRSGGGNRMGFGMQMQQALFDGS